MSVYLQFLVFVFVFSFVSSAFGSPVAQEVAIYFLFLQVMELRKLREQGKAKVAAAEPEALTLGEPKVFRPLRASASDAEAAANARGGVIAAVVAVAFGLAFAYFRTKGWSWNVGH